MAALGWIALTASALIFFAAFFFENWEQLFRQKTDSSNDDHSTSTVTNPTETLFIIGDLHGDVKCAKHWVQKTNLIPNLFTSPPSEWIWNEDKSDKATLLFLGDYIDKGPDSKPTLEFVKSLTDQFPQNVIAILGNHELELLKDRDGRYKTWGTGGYFQLPYATVHPAEYLHYLNSSSNNTNTNTNTNTKTNSALEQEKNELVVEALYNASMEVYASNLYRSVMVTPTGSNSITHLIYPPSWKKTVSEQLEVFQERYLNTFRTGTELGTWLESRPIMYMHSFETNSYNGSVLFVHGGLNLNVANYLSDHKEEEEKEGKEGKEKDLSGNHDNQAFKMNNMDTEKIQTTTKSKVDHLNSMFWLNSQEPKLLRFLMETVEGRLIEEMVVHRGNHKAEGCQELFQMLKGMKGVDRLGVGHTPDMNVRIKCGGKFLALDSLLGRWIREIGNDYCRGDKRQVSRNGRYECPKIKDYCEGQITRIRDGVLEII